MVDLSYKKKKEESEPEDEVLNVIGWLYVAGFSLFFVFMFFTGLCGGRFW